MESITVLLCTLVVKLVRSTVLGVRLLDWHAAVMQEARLRRYLGSIFTEALVCVNLGVTTCELIHVALATRVSHRAHLVDRD